MRQFLIATAAFSLLGGAAFAQTANNPTGNPISDSTAPAGASIGGQAVAGAMPQAADGSPAAPATGANPAPSSGMSSGSMSNGSMSNGSMSSGSMSSGSMASTGAMASNSPPATYPVCTSKHEDRCVNRSQATRTARLATRHQKTDNVQPAG